MVWLSVLFTAVAALGIPWPIRALGNSALLPLERMFSMIWLYDNRGLMERKMPTKAEMCGAAIDVPLQLP